MTLINQIVQAFRTAPYTIGITIVFTILAMIAVYYVEVTWIQPDNDKLIKQYCPNGVDKCGLIIDQNPITVIIPLGLMVLGLSLGLKLDGLSSTESQERKQE